MAAWTANPTAIPATNNAVLRINGSFQKPMLWGELLRVFPIPPGNDPSFYNSATKSFVAEENHLWGEANRAGVQNDSHEQHCVGGGVMDRGQERAVHRKRHRHARHATS